MTGYLLAGGGTAGHVNPLLAVADALVERDPEARVLVLGTREGLEARLVPQRGYELLTIPRLPFPRRPNADALRFLPRFRGAVARTADYVREHGIDVVVGFGGYAAAPAYFAARRAGVPLALHEANARPGLANRLGARLTRHVGVTFEVTRLPHSRVVGMPLRKEIAQLDRAALRPQAARAFGLDPARPTLLVTGGSQGARRLNETIADAREAILATGFQVLHVQGPRGELADPGVDGYRLLDYCDRMDLALALADFAVCRAGAGTVCELSAIGIPAVYVPFPIGNGEQRLNAAGVVEAGGGLLVADRDFTPAWARSVLVPLLADRSRVDAMAVAVTRVGTRDGAGNMVALVQEALA